MASVIKSVTFDSVSPLSLARFWATALGTDVDEDATADRAYVEAPGWGGPNMWFIRVPEPQTAKNRMHFDLRAPHTMASEVERLQAAGATVAERFDSHTVMRDPEGNVFCVELGPSDWRPRICSVALSPVTRSDSCIRDSLPVSGGSVRPEPEATRRHAG